MNYQALSLFLKDETNIQQSRLRIVIDGVKAHKRGYCDKRDSVKSVARMLKKHIKGRLLDQAVILLNCVHFQNGNSLRGKNLLPEGANSFL